MEKVQLEGRDLELYQMSGRTLENRTCSNHMPNSIPCSVVKIWEKKSVYIGYIWYMCRCAE